MYLLCFFFGTLLCPIYVVSDPDLVGTWVTKAGKEHSCVRYQKPSLILSGSKVNPLLGASSMTALEIALSNPLSPVYRILSQKTVAMRRLSSGQLLIVGPLTLITSKVAYEQLLTAPRSNSAHMSKFDHAMATRDLPTISQRITGLETYQRGRPAVAIGALQA